MFELLFLNQVKESKNIKINEISSFKSKLNECTQMRNRDICDSAIVYTEGLQRRAAKNRNYRCQSILIGLGSDLIMSSFKGPKQTYVPIRLETVQKICGYK